VKELISLEKVFIDVLHLLTVDFVNFVKAADHETQVIQDEDLNTIINYLPQLKSFSEDLLKDFESRMENWSAYPKISNIIVKKGPFLKLFLTYVQNLQKQRNYLSECCQKYSWFGKVVKDFEASECCQKLEIQHHMLKPLQRLPQYKLLLESYLSQQDSDSIDYEDTQQALQIVCDMVDHANKSVKKGVSICCPWNTFF